MGAESALIACVFFYQPDDTPHQAFPSLPELETLDQKERLLTPSEHRESSDKSRERILHVYSIPQRPLSPGKNHPEL